jgi:hypothetical protein
MMAATLLTGAPVKARRALLEIWREQAPGGDGWAVLRSASGTSLLPQAEGAPASDFPREGLWRPARRAGAPAPATRPVPGAGAAVAVPHEAWLETVQACLCCTPQPVLLAALGRLLRRGRWSHLLIDLEASGRPATMIDILRAPTLSGSIGLTEVVTVLDASLAQQALAAGRRAWLAEQVASADRLILRFAAPAPGQPAEPQPQSAHAEWLALQLRALADFDLSVHFWHPGSAPGLPSAGSVGQTAIPPAAGWGAAGRDRVAAALWRWQSGPGQVFDRRALAAVLGPARLERSFNEVRAVFRTEREWYRYRAGAAEPWEPTLYRSANRIELEGPLETTDAGRAPASEAALAALVRAIEACRIGGS